METKTAAQKKSSWNTGNLLTVPEVAGWARVHPKTVYRWISDGKLEAIQFGPRTYRIPEDAVSKFLRKLGYANLVLPSGKNGKG